LLAKSFRNYFIGSSTLLFTFPSRYSFTIGLVWYLALECGHPSLKREFAVSHPIQESLEFILDFAYTIFTFFDYLFHSILLSAIFRVRVLQPHVKRGLGFSLFARRLLRESLTISFPPGTKIFQFPDLPPHCKQRSHLAFTRRGYPIRTPTGHSFLPANRRLSRA